MEKFLVTGANGDIGDAVARVLKNAFPSAKITGADSSGLMPGALVLDDMISSPPADAPEYREWLQNISLQHDLVIPTTDAEVTAIARAGLDNQDAQRILMNAGWVVQTFTDKFEAARWFAEKGISTPHARPLIEAGPENLPLCIKPRIGHGSNGVQVITSPARLDLLTSEIADPSQWLAQDLVGTDDTEYTCALVSWGGQTNSIAMRRKLVDGATWWVSVETTPAIEELLTRLAQELPASSFVNVQLRLHGGVPYVFEINPRLSGTVMMRHLLGFRDLEWLIRCRKGDPLPAYRATPGLQVFRMSREVVYRPEAT